MRLLIFAWLVQTTLAMTSPLDLCTADLPYQRFHVRILFLCIRGAASDLLVQQLDHLRTDVLHCRDDFCLVNNLCLKGQLRECLLFWLMQEPELAKYLDANLMRELQCLAQFCTTPSENELIEPDVWINNTDIAHCRNRILP